MRRDKKFSSVTIILKVNWLFMRRQCGQVILIGFRSLIDIPSSSELHFGIPLC